MHRVRVVGSHLASAAGATNQHEETGLGAQPTAAASGSAAMPPHADDKMGAVLAILETLEDRTKLNPRLAQDIPGPLDKYSREQVTAEFLRASMLGGHMLLVEQWCREFGHKHSVTSNIVFPMTITPQQAMPYRDWLVTVGDTEDAARLLRSHVKKSAMYGVAFLGDGVLSTADNDLWIHQRKHFFEAFLPETVLKTEVFPVSWSRARFAAEERMAGLAARGEPFDVAEFLLSEALAQLQLALIGESEEDMNRNNKPLRKAFEGALTPWRDFEEGIKQRTAARREILSWSNGIISKCPQGPLGRSLVSNCPMGKDLPRVKRDSASVFGFAGFDTTGLMMTHLIYEVCRNPKIQHRLQAECDTVASQLAAQGREFGFADLQSLKFLSRCITETLRLWPSVPNGTFREVEFDDVIKGRDGKMVPLPKGTNLSIPVWLAHVNPELWGPDVELFNPDREFLPEEVWNGQAFAYWNPNSHRYMPFTAGPRDCLGKNFAHMESRVILYNLFLRYEFALAEPTLSKARVQGGRSRDLASFLSANNGTMAPKGGLWVTSKPRRE